MMIGLSVASGEWNNHFVVLYGYTLLENAETFAILDPQSSGTGKLTMNANTRLVTNSEGTTFIWDAGYFAQFVK